MVFLCIASALSMLLAVIELFYVIGQAVLLQQAQTEVDGRPHVFLKLRERQTYSTASDSSIQQAKQMQGYKVNVSAKALK